MYKFFRHSVIKLLTPLLIATFVLATVFIARTKRASIQPVLPTSKSTPAQSFIWPQISLATFKSGFSSPADIVNAGDGTKRLFIVERCGTIKIIDENGETLGSNFLNITNRVNCLSDERGLLSAAFPPNYSAKNYFYVFYTQANGALTVSRFHVPDGTPNQADANSEEIIITISHADNSNHNGGKLAFGNDGYLYFSTGDGGGGGDQSNNGQNKNSLLGKILRIDVESGVSPYAVPPDNPFVDASGLDEIWALGLRNSWRFSFDRENYNLYITDVGQSSWEEVNFQPASNTGGMNYGWRLREGNHCYKPSSGCGKPVNYSAPVTEYSHSLGCSVTGGYVYRGSEYTDMEGIYFYGDFCSGRIWGLKRRKGNWYSQMLSDTSHNISTFGEDEAGNLYLANLVTGTIYKIESSSAASN
jgi:glucose/arabinose dehydrogenase